MLPIYIWITPLTNLFNTILQSGLIPEQWVQSMIKPIYKNKGDPLNPENYRPIALLSCLRKQFTSIINERLNLLLNENNILLENQAGFRKKTLLLNLVCTQLLSLSSGSLSLKRDTFYVKWQPVASVDEKTSKNPMSAY